MLVLSAAVLVLVIERERHRALECVAIQDVLVISGGMAVAPSDPLKGS